MGVLGHNLRKRPLVVSNLIGAIPLVAPIWKNSKRIITAHSHDAARARLESHRETAGSSFLPDVLYLDLHHACLHWCTAPHLWNNCKQVTKNSLGTPRAQPESTCLREVLQMV